MKTVRHIVMVVLINVLSVFMYIIKKIVIRRSDWLR